MEELRRIGARTVPIVSRGKKFVFAQVIRDVVDFLELEDDTTPELSPENLAQRYDYILQTAIRLIRQMPDDRLHDELPNRPRSWRVLMHHVFQIPIAFLSHRRVLLSQLPLLLEGKGLPPKGLRSIGNP